MLILFELSSDKSEIISFHVLKLHSFIIIDKHNKVITVTMTRPPPLLGIFNADSFSDRWTGNFIPFIFHANLICQNIQKSNKVIAGDDISLININFAACAIFNLLCRSMATINPKPKVD